MVDVLSFDRYALNETFDSFLIEDCTFVIEFAQEHNKVATLAETGILYGIENITNPLWYENKLLKPIMEHCPTLAYALTFSNFEKQIYWVPTEGETTYPGFMEFYHDDHTMFLNDSLWHDSSYYNFVSGLRTSDDDNHLYWEYEGRVRDETSIDSNTRR